MVEPQRAVEDALAQTTPRASHRTLFESKDPHLELARSSRNSPAFYELAVPPAILEDAGGRSASMPSDADMPDSPSMPDHRSGSSRRRQHQRPPVHPLQPSAPPSYQSSYYSTPYQRGFPGQYTVSSPPPSMSITHTPPPPFAYSPYHVDGSMVSPPNIHAGYQSMLQPPQPVYSYQRHSPEGSTQSFSSPSHSSFSSRTPPTMYQSSPSPLSPQQSSAQQPPYVGSGQFPSLRYPPTSPQYYPPPQSFAGSSPIYHYPPQHFSSPDTESQGTWWYMPAAAPQQQQYEGSYQHQHQHYMYPVPQPNSSENNSYSPGAQYPPSPRQETAETADHHTPPSPPTGLSPHPPDGNSSSSSKRPVLRRHYHPNPPASRSEFVMWTGNVPSDATHDELWKFFTRPASSSTEETGVVSIFLIARSNCAFVNYLTEKHLQDAIERFNGEPLRPADPRCARLVCRVRRKDDDLKAGVGAQRGMGMHTRWIKERGKRESVSEPESPAALSNLSISSSSEDGGRERHVKHSSSSGSYASTNSSVLSRHFPQRYFILKSLTQYDLDLSVETNLWATQKHNEGILDQAYRTSKDVFLIFSVNKSGEFYGYARMAGPVRRGERQVSWASRGTTSPPNRSIQSPLTGKNAPLAATISLSRIPKASAIPPGMNATNYLSPSPGRQVDSSPLPVDQHPWDGDVVDAQRTPGGDRLPASAPAELGKKHRKVTGGTPSAMHSLDHRILRGGLPPDGFALDPTAPVRAIKQQQGSGSEATTLQSVEEEEEPPPGLGDGRNKDRDGDGEGEGEGAAGGERDETWGDCFQVQWLSTQKLSFYHTRHIRNPWNHDREVKVSRDGTELEPGVGRRLVEEWERLAGLAVPPGQGQGQGQQQGPTAAGGKIAAGAGKEKEKGVARRARGTGPGFSREGEDGSAGGGGEASRS